MAEKFSPFYKLLKTEVPVNIPSELKETSNDKKTKLERTRIVPLITTTTMLTVRQSLTPTIKLPLVPTRTVQKIRDTEDLDVSTHPVRPVANLIIPERNVTLEQMQRTDRLSGTDDRKDKTKSNRELLKATQMRMSKLQPKL